MMRMKAKQQEAPAPPYKATGMLKPTLDEIRNGYTTPEILTAKMRATFDTQYEWTLYCLVRATDRKNKATVALAEFSRLAYPRDHRFKATLARLQREEAEAIAELSYAEGLRDAAAEAA